MKNDDFKPEDEEERKVEHIDTEEELFNKLEEIISSDEKSTKYVVNKSILPHSMIRVFNNFWLDFLYSSLISMILVISFCGWFDVIKVDHYYQLLIIGGLFGIIDYLCKSLVFKLNPVLYLIIFLSFLISCQTEMPC